MQLDRIDRRGDGQFCLKAHNVRVKRRLSRPELRGIDHALYGEIDQAIDLASLLREFAFDPAAIIHGIGSKAAALLDIGLDVEREGFGISKLLAQAVHDGALDDVDRVFAGMIADAAFFRLGAADAGVPVGLSVERHAAAAGAAAKQAGQHSRAPWLVFGGHPAALDPGGYDREDFVIDDAQMRDISMLPLTLRVHAADPLAGIRIADHAKPIPYQPPAVDGISQHAIEAALRAVDRRCIPVGAARGRYSILIQSVGDLAGRFPGGEFLENAANDRSLVGIDLKLAGLAGGRLISIRLAACGHAVADAAGKAAPDLVREISQIKGADEAPDADLHGIGPSVVDSDDIDPDELQALEDRGEVFLITRKAIESFDDHHVECAGLRPFEER